jgi:acetyl esterase/lipase
VPLDDARENTRYVDTVFNAATTQTGITYGASVPAGGTSPAPLLLDLYTPTGDTASARPVLVWIHGGGFVSGTRTDGQIPRLARSMALRGYVSVSISYRLRSPTAFNADPMSGIRDAVHDARAAVRWVRANRSALKLDTARIAVVGSSAGGITALFAAYENAWGEGVSGNPGFSSDVAAVVSFWGSLPGAADSVMQAGEPPLLIFHGTEDMTVPYVEAQQLVARAAQVGVAHRLVTLTGQGHAAWNNVPLFEAEMTPFLSQQLRLVPRR